MINKQISTYQLEDARQDVRQTKHVETLPSYQKAIIWYSYK